MRLINVFLVRGVRLETRPRLKAARYSPALPFSFNHNEIIRDFHGVNKSISIVVVAARFTAGVTSTVAFCSLVIQTDGVLRKWLVKFNVTVYFAHRITQWQRLTLRYGIIHGPWIGNAVSRGLLFGSLTFRLVFAAANIVIRLVQPRLYESFGYTCYTTFIHELQ